MVILRNLGLVVCLIEAASCFGQNPPPVSVTDGYTPAAMTPGTPTGSYPLSGFENLNFGNGLLSFRFTFGNASGRGKVSIPLSLTGFNPPWNVQAVPVYAIYSQGAVLSIWKNNVYSGPYDPISDYGGGHIFLRTAAQWCSSPNPSNQYYHTWDHAVTRLTFAEPNGTEMELVDQQTGGKPVGGNTNAPYSRGTVFVSRDDSPTKFVSTTPLDDSTACVSNGPAPVSGTLFSRDGTVYTVSNGAVTAIEDRNGNIFRFDPNTGITDPLGRRYGAGPRGVSYPGVGGVARAITTRIDALQNALRSEPNVRTLSDLWPDVPCQAVTASNQPSCTTNTTLYNPTVVTEIDMPDNSSYKLRYNTYGYIAQIILPTGGKIEYDYGTFSPQLGASGSPYTYILTLPLTERREYARASDTSPYGVDKYSARPGQSVGSVSHYDGANHLLSKEEHTVPTNAFPSSDPTDDNSPTDGKETDAKYYDVDGTTVLREIATSYQLQYCVPGQTACQYAQLSWRKTTQGSQVMQTSFGYDGNNNEADEWDYDWGAGAPGGLLRRIHTDYVTDQAYTNLHILNLPSATAIEDANGVWSSNRAFAYDEQPLQDTPNITGHDSSYGSQQVVRGNVTTDSSWWAVGQQYKGYPAHHYTYDVAGNVVTHQDPNGNTATYYYTDGAYLHPNSIKFPSVNGIQQSTSAQYDYGTGKATQVTDENSVQTVYSYNDPLDRLTLVQRAAGNPGESRTAYSYPALTEVDTRQDQNTTGDGRLLSLTLYDGSGGLRSRGSMRMVGASLRRTRRTMRWGVFRQKGILTVRATATMRRVTPTTAWDGPPERRPRMGRRRSRATRTIRLP